MTKPAENDIRELFKQYGNSLREEKTETITYSQFGFTGERNEIAVTTDKFVLGTTGIDREGKEHPALCSDAVNKEWAVDFGTSGTEEGWTFCIDQIYNKPGAEAFQYGILIGFASPMVALSAREDWHGLPTAYIGETGKGKTSVALASCSMYGKPSLFEIKANKSGSTSNALVQRLATAKNLPVIFDETSTMDTDEMCEFLYASSNGRGKNRLTQSGKPQDNDKTWDMMPFLTSNKSLIELVGKAKQMGVQDATMVRMFEIRIDDYIDNDFYTEDSMHLVRYDLPKQYGVVGRKWIRFLMKHIGEIEAQVIKEERRLADFVEVKDTAERFQLRGIATVLAAGKITKKLGFHNFDMKAVREFAVVNLERMRDARTAMRKTSLDWVSEYLSKFHDGIIVTRRYPQGRMKPEQVERAYNRGEVLGRVAHEDKLIYINGNHFMEFLSDRGVSAINTIKDLYHIKALRPKKPVKPSDNIRKYEVCVTLGKGTDITTGQTWCFQLSYSKLATGGAALAPVQQGAIDESNSQH